MRKAQNSPVGALIKAYRERKGTNKTDLGRAIGVSYSYINNAEAGRLKVTSKRLEQLIEQLGLSSEEAQGLRDQNVIAHTSDDVRDWLKKKVGISAPAAGVEAVEMVAVPIISRCPAGDPKCYVDGEYPPGFAEEYFPMPKSVRSDRHAFLLRIEGDSMAPLLKDGSLVLVSPESPPRPGKAVVFKIQDECGCKLWYPVGDDIILRPMNTTGYRDRRVKASEIIWAYPVVKAIIDL